MWDQIKNFNHASNIGLSRLYKLDGKNKTSSKLNAFQEITLLYL